MRNISTEAILNAIANTSSMREAALYLQIPNGTFREKAKKLGVYVPNQGRKGGLRTAYQIAANENRRKSTYEVSRNTIKAKFLRETNPKYECDDCGIYEWKNKPLSLQLDHIDGNPTNNDFSNLRLLCPNCHTQTPTWGRKKR